MNSKLIKACLAGTAAVAVAAGGTTFAAWSDYSVNEDNVIGADYLALDVDQSGTNTLNDVKMYPGGKFDQEFVIASRDGDAVPAASLDFVISALDELENGCSSNTEEDSDTCESSGDLGEFDDQALISIGVTNNPIPGVDALAPGVACSQSTNPKTNALTGNGISGDVTIAALKSALAVQPLDLLLGDVLEPGEGVCVTFSITLPASADDAVQGDSVNMDLRFDLAQV